MEGLYKRWKKTHVKIRKPSVFLLGFVIVGLGIIDLPLPGPGWIIIFIGFAVLGSEFEFAARVRDQLVRALRSFIIPFKRAWLPFKRSFDDWMRT